MIKAGHGLYIRNEFKKCPSHIFIRSISAEITGNHVKKVYIQYDSLLNGNDLQSISHISDSYFKLEAKLNNSNYKHELNKVVLLNYPPNQKRVIDIEKLAEEFFRVKNYMQPIIFEQTYQIYRNSKSLNDEQKIEYVRFVLDVNDPDSVHMLKINKQNLAENNTLS